MAAKEHKKLKTRQVFSLRFLAFFCGHQFLRYGTPCFRAGPISWLVICRSSRMASRQPALYAQSRSTADRLEALSYFRKIPLNNYRFLHLKSLNVSAIRAGNGLI